MSKITILADKWSFGRTNVAPFPEVPQLGEEVALFIFGWLTPRDLAQVMLVSKCWQRILSDDSLWRRHCVAQGFLQAGELVPAATTLKEFYIA